MKIGFIGIGIMGAPMAENLLNAGFDVTVHTRTKEKAEPVIESGAKWAHTPAQCAEDKDFVITCVCDTPDVEKVLLGKDGIIKTAKPKTICIETSTISPLSTMEMSKKLAQKDITLLDAPISGGEIGAIQAKLSIMVGGDKKAFDYSLSIFQAMGKKITYCGPSGHGQKTKLANQVMVIHTIMSMAEGLAFAEKMGLDLDTTLDVTNAGAAGSKSLKILGPKVANGDMKPGFKVDLQLKDLRLVLEYAESINQPLPGVALAKQLLMSLEAAGRAKDGTQALTDIIRQLGGKKV